MRSAALLAPVLLVVVTGCDRINGPEEVRACEAYIKEQLRSPSTYVRAETMVGGDEPLSQAEFNRQYIGKDPDDLAKLLATVAKERRLAVRRVFIHYDADNAYGTPIRGMNMCEFLVLDGALEGQGGLESRAKSAASRVRLRELTEQLDNSDLRSLGRRSGENASDCCVRY
jgi:hypothetical protein